MRATIHGCDIVWPSPMADGAVAVGAAARLLGEEQLARDLRHCGEHALVGDPPLAPLALDHPRAALRQ